MGLFQIDSIVSNAKEIINKKNALLSNDGLEHQPHDEQHRHDFKQSNLILFKSYVLENQDLPPSFTDDDELEEKDSSLLKNEVKEKKSCDQTNSSMASIENSGRHAPPRCAPCKLCGMIKKLYWVQTPPQYS